MLHSLVVCSPRGVVRLSHFFVETTPEQRAAHELSLARGTAHLWAAARAVDIPVDVADGLSTVILSRHGLVFLASGVTAAGASEESLAEDAADLAELIKDVCDGNPSARLEDAGFVGKASVALEQAACSGVLAFPGADNALRLAKLKGPKTA